MIFFIKITGFISASTAKMQKMNTIGKLADHCWQVIIFTYTQRAGTKTESVSFGRNFLDQTIYITGCA